MEVKQGDKISYTVCRKKGRGYTLSSRKGVFIKSFNGGTSLVKAKNGRTIIINTSSIRKADKRNALTESILKAENIINTPGEEILKEVEDKYGNPTHEADSVRAMIEKAKKKAEED
jgi:dTDP-4-dehydrorhamnose reductase